MTTTFGGRPAARAVGGRAASVAMHATARMTQFVGGDIFIGVFLLPGDWVLASGFPPLPCTQGRGAVLAGPLPLRGPHHPRDAPHPALSPEYGGEKKAPNRRPRPLLRRRP